MKNLKFFGLLLAVFSLVSCRQNQSETSVRSVRTVNPVKIENVEKRLLPGVVKENQTVNLGFKTAGQIAQINVKEGDYVKEGQLLAKLDDKDYRLQLSATEIQYNQVKAEVGRLEELYKRNSIAGNDYEKAVAGLNALKVQLQAYQNQVAYTALEAPSSGYIQSVNFRKSEMVDAGRPVFTLMDVSSVVIETDLPANLYMQKENFEAISCRSNLFPDKAFALKMLSINQKPNGNQLYKMYLTAADPLGNALTAGMNVEIAITVRKASGDTDAYGVPANSVFTEGGKPYVWVLSSETVQKRAVQTKGVNDAGHIIVTGVKPQDKVVSAGVQYLRENEKVNVLSEESKTNVGGLL